MDISRRFFLAIILTLFSMTIHAQDNTSYELKDHIIYYNVFNSSLIPAKVASEHNLVRAKNQVYLNIALVKKSGGFGIPPHKLEGTYKNLIQQKFDLKFIPINEATTTYYLAPIRFSNEEILHLDITVQPDENSEAETFRVTKKLYVD